MAINNIKIRAHDIFIEKDNDKGGNLTVGATNATTNLTVHGSTTTDSLTVNAINVKDSTNTLTLSISNSKLNISGAVNVEGAITSTTNISMSEIQATGDLTVGTNDKSANVNVYGDIVLYGNTNGTRTISCNKGLNVNAPGVALSSTGDLFLRAGSTNITTINSPTMNIESTTVTISGTTNMNALNVTGDINNTGNLIVSANTTTNALTVTTNIDANGATIGTGGLTVGTNTNSANVNVFGNISINDNIVLRQNDSKTEIIVGSNDKPLKLFGSGDRPSYSKNGEGDVNIALANDICNPTITIKQAGEEKGSFTLNQSDAKTIELTDTTYTAGTGLTLSDGKFSVNVATSEALGGIKLGYSSSNKKYAVELDSENKAYVSVPWTDNNTTYSAGTGLELSGTTFNVKIEDNLTSSSTTAALSANQGRVLQSNIDTKANKSYVDSNYLSKSAASANYIQKGRGVPLDSIVFGTFTNFLDVSTTLSADSSGIYYYKFVGKGSLQIFDGVSNTDNTTISSSLVDGINEGFFSLSLTAETIGYSCKITLFNFKGITTITASVENEFKFKRTKNAVELYRVR